MSTEISSEALEAVDAMWAEMRSKRRGKPFPTKIANEFYDVWEVERGGDDQAAPDPPAEVRKIVDKRIFDAVRDRIIPTAPMGEKELTCAMEYVAVSGGQWWAIPDDGTGPYAISEEKAIEIVSAKMRGRCEVVGPFRA